MHSLWHQVSDVLGMLASTVLAEACVSKNGCCVIQTPDDDSTFSWRFLKNWGASEHPERKACLSIASRVISLLLPFAFMWIYLAGCQHGSKSRASFWLAILDTGKPLTWVVLIGSQTLPCIQGFSPIPNAPWETLLCQAFPISARAFSSLPRITDLGPESGIFFSLPLPWLPFPGSLSWPCSLRLVPNSWCAI